MYPEERPGSAVTNAGRPWLRSGFTTRSTRRSAIAWRVTRVIASRSRAWATGWPWKLPPETTLPSSSTSGLSVEALSSIAATPAAKAIASATAPSTWGVHRRL